MIRPAIVDDLTFAEAKTESLYGPIVSRWEKLDGSIRMNVTIPVNSTATVYVPTTDLKNLTESGVAIPLAKGITLLKIENEYAVLRVQSGDYRFLSK